MSATTVKLARQPAKDDPCAVEVVLGGGSECSLHSRLDGSGRVAIEGLSLSGQSQQPTAPIASVGPATDQTATLESLHKGRERTGVQVQNVGQLPRVNTRKPPDDPDHQALRTCNAQRHRHPLRSALKRVIDGPNQA